MKLLSLAGRPIRLMAVAIPLLAATDFASAQTFNSNFQVTITLPTNGSSFAPPANIQINALTFDTADDVANVLFLATPAGKGIILPIVIQLGTVSNGVAVGPPGSHQQLFTFTWSNVLGGTWTLRAVASRANGAVGTDVTSPPVTITVQPAPTPPIDIASPPDGALFIAPADIQLIAGVTESRGPVVDVQFFDGTNSLGVVSNGVVVDPPGSPGLTPGGRAYFLTWNNAPVGTHILTASALYTNGLSIISLPVTITVRSNLPPSVRITSPENRAIFRTPLNLALLAYAFDLGGYVSSVQFFAGSNSLGFALPLPPIAPGPVTPDGPQPVVFPTNIFEFIWSNAPLGSFALTAVATDNSGLSSTSAPVNITILSAPPPPTNGADLVSIIATDPMAIAGTNCWPWLGLAGGPPTWSNWVSPVAVWRWFTNCGPQDATFTVHRIGSTNTDLAVNYSIGGTAGNGIDFVTLSGAVTIPAGQTEAMITVVPSDDPTNNASQTVVLCLIAPTNTPPDYVLGFPRRAEALIIDSESPQPELSGQLLGDRSFFLSAGGPDGAWFRIDYTADFLNWVPLCTNQVVNGSIDFADPDAANSPMRFYRDVPLAGPPSN